MSEVLQRLYCEIELIISYSNSLVRRLDRDHKPSPYLSSTVHGLAAILSSIVSHDIHDVQSKEMSIFIFSFLPRDVSFNPAREGRCKVSET